MRKPLLALLCAAALFACGDNDHPGGDDEIDASPTPDAEVPDADVTPDAAICEDFPAGAPGGACENDSQCDSTPGAGDGFCYNGTKGPSTYPPAGYCIRDNGAGTICDSDDDCGAGNLCVTDTTGGGSYRYCAPACCTDPDVAGGFCPNNLACFDTFLGNQLDKLNCVPGEANAQDGDACAGFFDCNESSQCLNDFEHPGGTCESFSPPPDADGCVPGETTDCHGGICVPDDDFPFSPPICKADCTTNADCRGPEGYVCHDPDPGSTTDIKYCRHPHVGDVCTTPADCGGGTWTCKTDNGFTGYCTQSGCPTPGTVEGCTVGSVCYADGATNICVDRCDLILAADCGAGYACQLSAGVGSPTACLPSL